MADVRLKPLGASTWISDGGTVSVAGFHYPTRMAVIRLKSGDLFIWSPVALSDPLRTEVDGLGTVRFLVAPNSLHHLSLPEWKAAYPDALLYAAPGLRERRRDIVFDADLGDQPDAAWASEIDQVAVRGNIITTEVVFLHRQSGVVLFTDLLQQFPPGWFRGWRGIVAKLDGLVSREPQTPQKFRVAFTDRAAARAAVSRILDWPAETVVMAHGEPVVGNGQAWLARSFRWLTGR